MLADTVEIIGYLRSARSEGCAGHRERLAAAVDLGLQDLEQRGRLTRRAVSRGLVQDEGRRVLEDHVRQLQSSKPLGPWLQPVSTSSPVFVRMYQAAKKGFEKVQTTNIKKFRVVFLFSGVSFVSSSNIVF